MSAGAAPRSCGSQTPVGGAEEEGLARPPYGITRGTCRLAARWLISRWMMTAIDSGAIGEALLRTADDEEIAPSPQDSSSTAV